MTPSLWAWAALGCGLLALILLDLVWFGRRPGGATMTEAAIWSVVWFALGVGFTGIVWAWGGQENGINYLTGYLLERSLSLDNLFVFALIFAHFAVPREHRGRVLLWGVIGALVLRAVMIAAGVALIDMFHATLYVFGALLIVMGLKLARGGRDEEIDVDRNPLLRLTRRIVPMSDRYEGTRLLTRRNGVLVATPMVAVLVVIASTDVLFAVDSIPAIFAVTTEPFIVFAANALSLLGMRAAYLLLAGMMDRFEYLSLGLATVLVVVGVKMLAADVYHPPEWLTLAVVLVVIGGAVAASMRRGGTHRVST